MVRTLGALPPIFLIGSGINLVRRKSAVSGWVPLGGDVRMEDGKRVGNQNYSPTTMRARLSAKGPLVTGCSPLVFSTFRAFPPISPARAGKNLYRGNTAVSGWMPLAYAIESLTDAIEQGATALLDRIEAEGGTLAAIERGMIQREIQESAYQDQQAVESGGRVVIGVNHSTDDTPVNIDVLRIDAAIERDQCARVALVRASRDETEMRRALDRVTRAARDGTNLVPPIIDAVEARATVGEVADTLRAVFGEHREDGI